jgi:tetratricopeptide (TPR) repeat protein
MEATAGHSLDAAGVGLAHALYRETDGNPFFVGEVLRHLSETGAIYQDSTGRWVAEDSFDQMALPDSVREVIGARVVRLGGDAERVLSMAAVIGRDFDLDVLARATGTTDDYLLDVLDQATAAALVRERTDAPGRYSFAHALIQHTLYADLGPTRRARAHRHVAEAIEGLSGGHPGARVGELARHWFNATQAKDLAKALDYSRQAADAALRALAPGDAVRYYTQALDLYAQADEPDPVLGLDLAIGLGTAQHQTGNPEFRDTLLEAARQAAALGNTHRLVTAALANDRGLFSTTGTVDADRVEILEAALSLLPAGHPDRALVLATLCKELIFGSSIERRQALANEAVTIAQSLGDNAVIVRVINNVAQGLQAPPLMEQGLVWTTDALARAEQLGDPLLLFFAASRRCAFSASAGDIREMDRCLEIMDTLAEQLNQPTLHWLNTLEHATAAVIAGDTDRAEQLATDALQIGTDGGEPDAASIFGAQLLTVSFQRGTMGGLVPLIEQVAADNPGAAPTAISVIAAAHAEADRLDEARRQLEYFASKGFELPIDMIWINGMTMYAEAAIECRDAEYAQPLFDRLTPYAHRLSYNPATAEGPVGHFLGGLAAVLGRYDEADTYFTKAAAFSNRMGAKFFAARTNLLWAKMLARRRAHGDAEKVQDLLTEAHTVATAQGYGTVERRAGEALLLLGL